MSLLVVGSSGQLARHLRETIPDAIFWSRADADLAEPAGLTQKVRALAPTCIVNAAAYTAVDRAESEAEIAWRVNAEAPAALAVAAAELGVPLVHVSTDYVFDGRSDRPYHESDPVNPLGVYGATKLAGELAVRSICARHWILRTSWVFSEFGSNFVKTMLRLASQRDELNVVADQRGRPTYAGDLARLIATLVHSAAADVAPPFGTYHVAGGRAVSWYEFAKRIIARAHELGLLARMPAIHPIPTSAYPTPARRPLNSVMEQSSALQSLTPFDWESGLDAVLTRLRG